MKIPQELLVETMDSSTKIKIANASEIEKGKSIVVMGPEGLEIALFRSEDGAIYALDNACPHMGGPLGEGEMEGCVVTCPWHGWQFDIRDGSCQNMPGDDAIPLRISVENDEIFLVK